MMNHVQTGGRPTSVLIIEDDDEDYVLTRRRLSASGAPCFDISRAADLDAGLAHLRRGGVDVVLLDLGLPDSTGWATLDTVLQAASGTPIIVLTGRSDEGMGMDAVRHGAQDYLFKDELETRHLASSIRYAIERKKTEEALRVYRERLEELVERRTARLCEALSRLEEHNRAKSRFVASVSHDLKTPIASMGYAIGNLLRGVAGAFPPRAESYLRLLKEDCRRITHTLNDILDMSQIEEHRLVLRRVRIPFHRFCAEAIHVLRQHAREKGVQMDLAVSRSVGLVDCDPSRLERPIFNVVENAIKYTPSRGVVEVSLGSNRHRTGCLYIRVLDTGIGIGPDHLPHIAQAYYRANEHAPGSGLGLAVAREIVELHGGRLNIQSPPPGRDRGTSVTIEVPAGEPSTVLVVDSDETARGVIAHHLESEGYAVTCCAGAAEAIDAARAASPAAAVVNLILPDRDGVELIATFKSDADLRDVPVVAITGGEIEQRKREVLQSFAIPAVRKPLRQAEIANLVYHAILSGHYAARSRPPAGAAAVEPPPPDPEPHEP